MTDVVMHPGDVWISIIRNAGVTQAFVAGQMGVTQKHLSQIIQRHRLPSALHTVAFAHLMGADPQKLWAVKCEYELGQAEKTFKAKRIRGLPAPPEEWAS